ncbi:MAG: redoxin domain-containing protein [Pseudomonadota bacterium]
MTRVTPADRVPDFEIGHLDAGRWRLDDNAPAFLLMLDVYRGLHCPRCRRHLEALSAEAEAFRAVGVDLLAVSTDPLDRAATARQEWDIGDLPMGYGLDIATARGLGCYVSRSIREGETDVFAEPGVFFIRPDLTLYGAVLGTFPFARPAVGDLLEVATILRDRNYPPRGTVAA